MARKKTPKKANKAPKTTMSKADFVRSVSTSVPGADVVKRAKAAGLSLSLNYVYAIRTRLNAKRKPNAPAPASPSPVKRGAGRPRSTAATNGSGSSIGTRPSSGLETAIEAIVERKVHEMLKARLGALFAE